MMNIEQEPLQKLLTEYQAEAAPKTMPGQIPSGPNAPGAGAPPASSFEVKQQHLEGLNHLVFNLALAKFLGKKWALSEEELKDLSEKMYAVVVKYDLGRYVAYFEYAEIAELALCLGGIILERVTKEEAGADRGAGAEAQKSGGDQPGPGDHGPKGPGEIFPHSPNPN